MLDTTVYSLGIKIRVSPRMITYLMNSKRQEARAGNTSYGRWRSVIGIWRRRCKAYWQQRRRGSAERVRVRCRKIAQTATQGKLLSGEEALLETEICVIRADCGGLSRLVNAHFILIMWHIGLMAMINSKVECHRALLRLQATRARRAPHRDTIQVIKGTNPFFLTPHPKRGNNRQSLCPASARHSSAASANLMRQRQRVLR